MCENQLRRQEDKKTRRQEDKNPVTPSLEDIFRKDKKSINN